MLLGKKNIEGNRVNREKKCAIKSKKCAKYDLESLECFMIISNSARALKNNVNKYQGLTCKRCDPDGSIQ